MKIIRRAWLPYALPQLAVWFMNFSMQFAKVATELGFTAADVTKVNEWNATVQWLADGQVSADANHENFRVFRENTLFGEKGEPAPVPPSTELPPAPPAFATSVIYELTKFVGKIESADNYTTDIGAVLGILPPTPGKTPAQDVKLKVKVFSAATGYVYTVMAEDRAEADSWDVYVLRKGAANWEFVRTVMGKSIDLVWTPTTAGEPEQFQLRIQGRRKNQNYGQPSDPTFVTANP